MARIAQIIETIKDAWGDDWDVREYRQTAHDFEIAFGWPYGSPRGKGGSGGVKVIVTPDLLDHFETYRLSPINLALPIGNTTIKRIRRLLGHHRQIDRAAWWEERVADLADLTLDQFAARHDVSVGAAANARHALFGHTLRPAGWWRQKDMAEILLSADPRSDIADTLGISVGSVGRLRWCLMSAQKMRPGEKRAEPSSTRPYGWSKEFLASMEKLITEGRTAVEVGRQVGVPVNQVRYAVKSGHLTSPGHKGQHQTPDMDRAIEMVRHGATYSEAARTYGFTSTGVASACKKVGVESHKAHFTRR